jgi:hypothetical protein
VPEHALGFLVDCSLSRADAEMPARACEGPAQAICVGSVVGAGSSMENAGKPPTYAATATGWISCLAQPGKRFAEAAVAAHDSIEFSVI